MIVPDEWYQYLAAFRIRGRELLAQYGDPALARAYWNRYMSDNEPARCEDCGTVEGVKYVTCPFAEDIHEKIIWVWLCDTCWQQRG